MLLWTCQAGCCLQGPPGAIEQESCWLLPEATTTDTLWLLIKLRAACSKLRLHCPTGTPRDSEATAGGCALAATQSRPATRSLMVPVPCASRHAGCHLLAALPSSAIASICRDASSRAELSCSSAGHMPVMLKAQNV